MENAELNTIHRDWPHAPPHRFVPNTSYIVTASTYGKQHYFKTPARLSLVRNALFDHLQRYGWRLEAWAVLANHYHFVAMSPQGDGKLPDMLRSLHSATAADLNQLDATPGRQVWFNYRDTCLTDQRSHLARLHYVHRNPERHGVVGQAEQYPWCSMAWFVEQASPAFRKSVLSFKIDRVNVPDDF